MTAIIPKPSYTGEHIYVGIDVHKKKYVVVARVAQVVVKKWTTLANPQSLAQQLQQYFAGGIIHSVYEAGFSGFSLHRELSHQGIDSIVVHAAAVEGAIHNRVKTDKRDAAKLATQLEAKRLRGIRVPSVAQEQQRLLSRTYAQFVQERATIKNQIRMKAHQFGLIEPEDCREMSHSLVQIILNQSPSPEFTLVVTAHWQVWQALDEQIQHLKCHLKQQAEADPNDVVYRSVPGVGLISARVLANELGDMSAFSNERQLFSYTGLTPSEHSSGEHIHRGHITKQGNRYLRGLLLEIAWRAVRKDPALARCLERLTPRTGRKRAIIAVARKLIGKIRAAFRHGEGYQIDYPNALGGSL
jgi:transposase